MICGSWVKVTSEQEQDAMNKRTFDGICSRREQAISLKHQGLTIKDIADRLGVSSKTIKRDFIDQGIETWSSISNDEVIDQIIEIIEIEHKSVGIKKIDSHIFHRGFRVQ